MSLSSSPLNTVEGVSIQVGEVEFVEDIGRFHIETTNAVTTSDHIDKKLTALLMKTGENDLFGKLTYISGKSDVKIVKEEKYHFPS